jgi:hypothetical protein
MAPFGRTWVGRHVRLRFTDVESAELLTQSWTGIVTAAEGAGGPDGNRHTAFAVVELDRPVWIAGRDRFRLAVTRRLTGLLATLTFLGFKRLDVNVHDAEQFDPRAGWGGLGIAELRWE